MEGERFKYRLLGSSGLRVSPLCLGCMHFGNQWEEHGIHMEETEADRILRCYIEGGGNFLDTACNYQMGDSERMVGRLIKKNGINRDSLVLATKYSTSGIHSKDPNMYGNHKKNMRWHVNRSLENLQTDYIDLLYVHWWGWGMKPKTLMKELDDLVRSGKVLHIAISNAPSWIVAACQERADLLGLHRFCAFQPKYSLIERSIEQDIIPMCKEYDIGIVPWGVVGAGVLAGKRKKEELHRKSWVHTDLSENVVKVQELLQKLGQEKGVSAANVAMNWAMNRPGITSVLVGSRSLEQMKDTMKCMSYKLSQEEENQLNELTKDMPGYTYPGSVVGTDMESCGVFDFPQQRPYLIEKTK